MDLKSKFRHVMDFPEEGVDFIDITTILQDPDIFSYVMDCILEIASSFEFDLVVAPESRGFILGTPIAYALHKGFIPIRKKGKLPFKTVSVEYSLEYGTNIMEMHVDAVKPGQKVLVIDDLLATGGTTKANIELVEQLGGEVVAVLCLVELDFLNGREFLGDYEIRSIVHF